MAEQKRREFFAGKGLNGLANVSNTCYVNTIVQCLGHCTEFLHFVLAAKHGTTEETRTPLLKEFRDILIDLWINDASVIPNRFIQYLRKYITGINIFEQNDAQEFLTIFMDKLNYSISQGIDAEAMIADIRYGDIPMETLRKRMDTSWYKSVSREYSPLIDYFYGQAIVQIVCGNENCKKLHHNYENFSVLLIPIPEKHDDVVECLRHYTQEEYLNDPESKNDSWRCDVCKQQAKSLKTMKFSRLPRVLVICLKRFNYDMTKNNVPVRISQALDMKEYVLWNSVARTKYSLRSIACHSGSFHNGHYWAICQNPNGKWYRIDDTLVNEFNPAFESSGGAYLMFYEAVAA